MNLETCLGGESASSKSNLAPDALAMFFVTHSSRMIPTGEVNESESTVLVLEMNEYINPMIKRPSCHLDKVQEFRFSGPVRREAAGLGQSEAALSSTQRAPHRIIVS